MSYDTQPLVADQMPSDEYLKEKAALEIMEEAYAKIHVHGPFTFLMNQNHNALRGCITCGQTWCGLMAGDADSLMWHPVAEPVEDEV